MTELHFEYHCGRCLSLISPNAGIVLSCGDFLCSRCSSHSSEPCSVCGAKDIRVVSLNNPPLEVSTVLSNPASNLQTLFELLKFQTQHYKKSLQRANQLLQASEDERKLLQRNTEAMAGELESLRKHSKTTTIENSTTRSFCSTPGTASEPRIFWKSGTDENALYRTTTPVQDSPSGRDHRSGSRGGMNQTFRAPSPSPNRGFSSRVSTPYSSHRALNPNDPHANISYNRGNKAYDSPRSDDGRAAARADRMDGTRSIRESMPSTASSLGKRLPTDRHEKRPYTPNVPRLRSPYIPMVRTPGKVARLSRSDI